MTKPNRVSDFSSQIETALPKGYEGTVADLHVDDRAKLIAVINSRSAGYVFKSKPDNSDGPTARRVDIAECHVAVGDDKMGGKLYQFLDSPLERVYGRLARSAKTDDAVQRLAKEYEALSKYRRLFVESGMIGSIGSVDPNRTYSPNPAGRSFLASTERQQDCRDEYRRAVIHLNRSQRWGHKQTIVVDNVVNHEQSLVIAGFSIGGGKTPSSAQERAERILRDAGHRLSVMWGMAR